METPGKSGARIDDLEARLAQQDQSILELSDEIYRQQKQIAQLETKVRDLTDRLRAASAAEPATDAANEAPPHY
jgi:SlyX protein